MACESKKISELTEACLVNPNDILPIVQDGTNKYVKVKDLLKGKCGDDTQDDCCCSKALSKAITALDFSRTAMDLANKAFDKACLVSTRLAALEEKVNEHDTLICNIQSNITRIFNQLEELGNNLKVSIVISSDEQNVKYRVLLGSRDVETILVPKPTTDFERGDLRPADAAEVLRRLRDFKGEVSKNLTFRAGRFGADDTIHDSEYYNGLNPRTVNIPTRLGHLTDVDASNPSSGDVLYYDGTKWVNVPIDTLIAQNLDCDAIKACFSTENFKVAPLVVTLEYNERVANFAVTSSGAWKIQKVTSGDNVFTASILDNVHLNPGTNLPLVITANSDNTTGQNREVEWDVIPWITVPGLIETQRIKVILKPQSAPPTPTNRTITYNISGGLTNSIKVNNEVVGNGSQKTAPDGSNYTVPIVSNDPGYRIASVTPSAGTYNTGTGTLTINPITSDVTVLVVLEEIPAGTHNVTYVVDGDASKIINLPNSPVIVTNGLSYSYTPTVELGYEIPANGVTFNPNGNGTYNGTAITIPQEITTNTEVIIRVVAEGLAVLMVTPISLEIEPEGTTNPEIISVSTTCTTSGITINDDNLPSGIDVNLNSAQTEIEVEVASSVAAGDYTFTVSDNCRNTKTVTITKKDSEKVNLFENVNFSNKKFNAFGVIEERLNSTQPVALDPEVVDPYDARTYTNGSMYYLADLGSWEDISDNIDPELPISLAGALGPLIELVNGGQHDLNWLKDSVLVQERLAAIKNNTNLIYYDNIFVLDSMTPALGGIIPAEYEQKSSAANTFPFYVVIAEDTSSINTTSDLWDAHVYVQLWCQPTNFLVSHPDYEVPLAHYEWRNLRYEECIIGLVWEYEDLEDPSNNYKMVTYDLTGLERERYMLSPGLYLYKRDIICNTYYIDRDFYIPISSDNYTSNITELFNPTIAAFRKTNYSNLDFPDYSVKISDSGGSVVTTVNAGITTYNNEYCLLVVNFPNIEELYTIEITATSTDPLQYPSLTWSANLYISDSGRVSEPTINTIPIKLAYTNDGGYYGDGGSLRTNRTPGIDGPEYSPSSSDLEKVGSGCAIRFNDTGSWTNVAISAGSNTINIPSTDFISWGTEENYNGVLNGAFTASELICPPPPLVFKGIKNGANVMELYIPYVSLNTQITVS